MQPCLLHHHLFYRIIPCFISCTFFIYLVNAQNNFSNQSPEKISADVKKVEALEKRSLDISAIDLDSAILLANIAFEISNKIKNDTCFGFSYMALGWCQYYAGNRDSAEYLLLKSAGYFQKCKMPFAKGRALINLGYVYQEGEEYLKLINCLQKARPLVEKDEFILSVLDLTMGSTYGDMQQYEQGKKYIFSALATTQKLGKTDHLSSCYSAIGYLLMQQGDFDSSLYYYRKGYKISVQLNDVESAAIAADNLGEVFQKIKDAQACNYCIDSSYHYYLLSLKWFTEMNSIGNIEYARMNLGNVLISKKEYQRAEKYLTESFHYFDSIQDAKYAYTASVLLSKLYYNLGDFKQAYNYNIVSLGYKDSLDRQKRTDSIARMFAVYETEKRDKEIQLLNANAKLNKEKIERQYMLVLFAITSLVFTVILLIVALNRHRIKQQLKEVKVRNQLAADLHDEVGSSLSSILLLSKMAANSKSNNNDGLLQKISGYTKEVIDKMGDIVWMMNPKYDEGENLREKLEQFVARIKDVATFKTHLEIDSAIDAIKFAMETRKAIFLIVKEAANNAVKYANAANFYIQIKLIEKKLLLNIEDDGVGFETGENSFGNGLDTMTMRTKNIQGTIEIHSKKGSGTKIKIAIPIPHFREIAANKL